MITIACLLLLSRYPATATSGFGYVTRYSEPGRRTASGERFRADRLAVACRAVPLGTRLRITHGRRSVVVRVNDRGPFPERVAQRYLVRLQARVVKDHPEYAHRPLRVNYPLDATPRVWRALGCTDVSWVRWEIVR